MKDLKSVIEISKSEQGSAIPYILGWLMGVPLSVLLLIAMFRAVF